MRNTLNLVYLFIIIIAISSNITAIDPTPSTNKGFYVVIIEETEKRQELPSSQVSAINSQTWRDYMSKNEGKWRVLDQHAKISNEESWVKSSMSTTRESLPWLIINKNKEKYSGPLPKNLDGLMELIKK